MRYEYPRTACALHKLPVSLKRLALCDMSLEEAAVGGCLFPNREVIRLHNRDVNAFEIGEKLQIRLGSKLHVNIEDKL